MVVISVLATLAALAAPSFTSLMQRWRTSQVADQLKSTLYYARSEAIKHGGRVAIQKLPNGTNGCTTANTSSSWDCGWIVCEDLNSNGKCASGEPILQRYDTPHGVQVSRTGGAASIKLNRWGLIDGTWLGFNLIPADEAITHPAARGVCMSSGGRIRVIPPDEIPCTG